MSQHDIAIFFLQIAVMLTVALVCGWLARRVGLPAVLGELIGGILLGPTLFARCAPRLFEALFPSSTMITAGRETILLISIVLFLLTVGMELHVGDLQKVSRHIFWTSLFGIALPFATGFGLIFVSPSLWGDISPERSIPFAFFIGTALSISALPVISRILMDLHLLKTRLGAIIISSATINDVIGWLFLAIVMNLFEIETGNSPDLWITLLRIIALFTFMLTVGRAAIQRFIHWFEHRYTHPGLLIGIYVILTLFAAAIAEGIGLHAIFGAFLVGLTITKTKEHHSEVETTLHWIVQNICAPLYFVSIGLKADFFNHFDLQLVLIVVGVACIGKIVGATIGARISRLRPREALAIGFGMNARGAMEILIASIALQFRIIDERIFVALVIMAFVTTIIAGPMLRLLAGMKHDNAPSMVK